MSKGSDRFFHVRANRFSTSYSPKRGSEQDANQAESELRRRALILVIAEPEQRPKMNDRNHNFARYWRRKLWRFSHVSI